MLCLLAVLTNLPHGYHLEQVSGHSLFRLSCDYAFQNPAAVSVVKLSSTLQVDSVFDAVRTLSAVLGRSTPNSAAFPEQMPLWRAHQTIQK